MILLIHHPPECSDQCALPVFLHSTHAMTGILCFVFIHLIAGNCIIPALGQSQALENGKWRIFHARVDPNMRSPSSMISDHQKDHSHLFTQRSAVNISNPDHHWGTSESNLHGLTSIHKGVTPNSVKRAINHHSQVHKQRGQTPAHTFSSDRNSAHISSSSPRFFFFLASTSQIPNTQYSSSCPSIMNYQETSGIIGVGDGICYTATSYIHT